MCGKVTQGGLSRSVRGTFRGRRWVCRSVAGAVNTAGPPMGLGDVRAGRARRGAGALRERSGAGPARPPGRADNGRRRRWELPPARSRTGPALRRGGEPSDTAMGAAGGPGVG